MKDFVVLDSVDKKCQKVRIPVRNTGDFWRGRHSSRVTSLIMGNVRSLGNKMDELAPLTRSHQEYWECSLMIFSESWLHTDVPDHNVSTKGFHTVRADRDCTMSGKRKGGGLLFT